MTWAKGVSGNPGGAANRIMRGKRMLEGLSLKAVGRLGQMLDDPDPRIAFPAAKEILARTMPIPKAPTNILAVNTSTEHMRALLALADKVIDHDNGTKSQDVGICPSFHNGDYTTIESDQGLTEDQDDSPT